MKDNSQSKFAAPLDKTISEKFWPWQLLELNMQLARMTTLKYKNNLNADVSTWITFEKAY